jgi:ribosomal protein L9
MDKKLTPTSKEMGLIKHLSNRNHQLHSSEKNAEDFYKNALKMIYELDGDVFTYAYRCRILGKAYGMSKIADYTNKKGELSKVHYNKNGCYMGSVKKLGKEPIPVLYQTGICKELFIYDPIKNGFVAKQIEE